MCLIASERSSHIIVGIMASPIVQHAIAGSYSSDNFTAYLRVLVSGGVLGAGPQRRCGYEGGLRITEYAMMDRSDCVVLISTVSKLLLALLDLLDHAYHAW